MAKIIAALVLMFALVGCASVAPKPEVQYIAAECPKPQVIERPDLDTDYLTEKSGPDQVIQAHRLTIKKLQKWGLEQEAILNGYRKK